MEVNPDSFRTAIRTRRLDLIPATVALLDAELESPHTLASLLGGGAPDGWPPGEYDASAMKYFRDRLAEDPDALGWYGWYALLRSEAGGASVLIGAGGFLGPPDADGAVEIGYSVLRGFEGRGYATELVCALLQHAFATGQVRRIVAHTARSNLGSIQVLERAGFRLAGHGQDRETLEYHRWLLPA
jgi:RimJ/RimL family protein N-acetyltransferase